MESPLSASAASRFMLEEEFIKMDVNGTLLPLVLSVACDLEEFPRSRHVALIDITTKLTTMRVLRNRWLVLNPPDLSLFTNNFNEDLLGPTTVIDRKFLRIFSDSASELALRNPAYMRSKHFDPENHVRLVCKLALTSDLRWGKVVRLGNLINLINIKLSQAHELLLKLKQLLKTLHEGCPSFQACTPAPRVFYPC